MEEVYGRDWRYYIKLARRRFALWLVPMLLIAAGGVAIILSLQKVYHAEAAILVEPQRMPIDTAQVPVQGDRGPSVQSELFQLIEQQIMTRDNLLSLVERFGLFSEQKDTLTRVELANLMRESIQITRVEAGPLARRADSPTFTFTVGFDYEDPHIAADLVNEIAASILEADARHRIERAASNTRILQREVGEIRGELAAIDERISQFTQVNIGALPGRLEFYLTQLETKKSDLNANEAAIRVLDDERRLLNLELRLKAVMGSGSTDEQSVGTRLESLRAQLAEKSSILSDNHPDIRFLKQQIAVLQDQIVSASSELDATGNLDLTTLPPDLRLVAERINALNSRRKFLAEQQTAILGSISSLQQVVEQTPEVEAGLQKLQRQREGVQRSLDDLTGRLTMAELRERLENDSRAERLKLVEPPIVPKYPIKPNRKKLLALVLGLAFAAGAGVLIGVDALDQTVRGSMDLRSVGGAVPVISVPYLVTRKEQRKRKSRMVLGAVSFGVLTIGSVTAVHFYLSPLDTLAGNIEKQILRVRNLVNPA